jgi:hypothetical protein
MTELNCSLRSLQIALEPGGVVGGFSMFAPPICRRRWRNNAFRSVSSDEDGGNPANIAASGASNQQRAMREQKDQ